MCLVSLNCKPKCFRIAAQFLPTNVVLWSAALAMMFAGTGSAQSTPDPRLGVQAVRVPPRVSQAIDEQQLLVLPGNVHPLARPEHDLGAVSDAEPMKRILLLLQRSPDQETALQQLLDQQQNKSSVNYHAWMTPEQFGRRFGPADEDIQAVANWLQEQGFQVNRVSAGRTVIEFSGTAGQVLAAFHTQMRRFAVDGRERMANSSDPQIPAALSPVVAGLVSLHNFDRKSYARYVGPFRRSGATGETKPLFTFPRPNGNGNFFGLAPADFAKIYNTEQLGIAGIDGTGQTIAVVGETNINLQDVQDFRSIFGLPKNDPQIILNGEDPGITSIGEEAEANLDVQWSGAVAKNATIKFVVSASTPASAGVDLSALYIIENNLAPVLTESYGDCEANLGVAGNQFYSSLWKQAAAQGITVIVASGDGGSAGCDNFDTQATAKLGLAVSGFASTPYNVSVGGTDFDQTNKWLQYWNATNDPATQLSAKSYIPEIPWNESCAQLGLTGCGSSAPQGSVNILAGSGGPSAVYAKPTWQLGVPGMPNDNTRDQPDIAFFAGLGFTGTSYIYCQQDRNSSGLRTCDLNLGTGYLDFHGIGGTSAAAPAFAGIMAMVNQYQASHGGTPRQGNANYTLYALAKRPNASCNASAAIAPGCVFYDVTRGNSQFAGGVGSNSVPCDGGSLNCSSTAAQIVGVMIDPQRSATEAWTASAGYDLATGLGSVNAYNLATNWSSVSTVATSTSLTLSPTTGIRHGQNENVSVNATVLAASGSVQPTGLISLLATPQGGATLGLDSFTLSGGAVSGQKTQNLPGGTYQVIAHYAGDGTFAPSDSPGTMVTVGSEGSESFIIMPTFEPQTGIQTSGNATTMVYGTPSIIRTYVTNSAAVANPGGPPSPLCATVNLMTCPSGTIALTDNGAALDAGTYTLNNAGYTRDLRPLLAGGIHQLMAQYSGDISYTPSTSATDTITITPAPSATAFNTGQSSPLVGQNFSIEVNASMTVGGGAAPTGTFTFQDAGIPLAGTVTILTAQGGFYPAIWASFSTALTTVGTHNITATYNGDANYAPSTTPVALQEFARYPEATNITVIPNNVKYGAMILVTATVMAQQATPPLSGALTFYSPFNTVDGPVTTTLTTDASGNQLMTASYSTTPLTDGYISALYGRDPNYADGSSSTVFITVNIPDFSINFPSASVLIQAGQPAMMQMSIIPSSNDASQVSLSCNGSPPNGYSCSVQPALVNLANGVAATATLVFTPQTIHSNAFRAPLGETRGDGSTKRNGFEIAVQDHFWQVGVLSGIAALLILGWPGRRKRLHVVAQLGFVSLASLIMGCGGGGGSGSYVPPPVPPPPSATSITVSTSASSVAQNSPLTFTAKVAGGSNPTGSVTFFMSGSYAGTANLVGGAATLITTIGSPGLYSVTAQYSGDAQHLASTSAGINQVVSGSTLMQVNGNTSSLGHTVNLTVTLQ